MRTRLNVPRKIQSLFVVMFLCASLAARGQTVGAKAVAWGDNSRGQTNVPASVTNALAIAAGGYHCLALRPGGRVTAWGFNVFGQSTVPATLTNAVAIAAGYEHSLALKSDGTLAAWGVNSSGQTTIPAAATNVMGIAAGMSHTLAVTSNGTVIAWGGNNFGQINVPAGLSNVVAVAAGANLSLALLTNGTVVAWGQYTNVPAGLMNVTAIAAGGSASLALKSDGTVTVWGDNTYGQTNVPPGLSNVVSVSAGSQHVLTLRNDGTVVIWGANGSGQTNTPPGLNNFSGISGGYLFTLALVNDGPVTFLSPPPSQAVYPGQTALFAPPFLGAAPMTYQWLQNGTNAANGTNGSLTITNAQFADAGNYQLVVSNTYGAVTSAVAVLTVNTPAPLLTAQPANSFVLQNSNALLTASAMGLPPVSYQWYFNGSIIPDATNLTLVITNAVLTNEGDYSIGVSNAYGTAVSSNAFLNVVDIAEALGATNLVWINGSRPPWFPETSNTLDGFAAEAGPVAFGSSVGLLTTVTGPGTLSFAWQTSGSAEIIFFSAGPPATLSFPSWTTSTFYLGSGIHDLSWSAQNPFGGPNSTAFIDKVTYTSGPTPVFISSEPASHTNAAGNNTTFSVGAAGTPPFGYQWYFDNLAISGGTQASLTVTNIQTNNVGVYNVVVTNGYGSAVSSNATLNVTNAPPTLTAQPANTLVFTGGSATLSGSAIGSFPISYLWLFNGSPIYNATNSSLTIGNAQSANVGNYSLAASNAFGFITSSNASLGIYTIADLASALDSPTLAWTTTNVPWFPETNITHDGISAAQSGFVSGSQSSTLQTLVSGPATVTFWWKVSCDSSWMSLAFSLGGSIQNAISGTVDWQQVTNYIGPGSQKLQWNLYPVHNVQAGGTAWLDQVQVSSGGTAPAIATNPRSTTNSAGTTASFSVSGVGTPPFFYQWLFGGTDVAGATNSVLTLNNIQTNNAGIYDVIVSNAFGASLSANATLVVNPSGPIITAQSTSQSAAVNGSVTLAISVQGSSPFIYQWYFDGASIAGATTASLPLTELQSTNSGNYYVIVTNNYGAATSSIIALEVIETAVKEFWAAGTAPPYSTPLGLSNVVAIAAGDVHTAALRNDGTVTTWGLNTYGQTNEPIGLSNVLAISAGSYHTVALKADGTVAVWGDNSFGQLSVPSGLSNVLAVAAGNNDTFALKSDGTVVGWGSNITGQTNIPAGLNNVVAAAAGFEDGFAIKSDGSVVQWGQQIPWYQNGALQYLTVAPGMSNITAMGVGTFSAWTLQTDGTVLGWGFDGPAGFSSVTTLSVAGDGDSRNDYVLVLKNDGTVAIGGAALSGYTPYIPASPSNVVAVATGTNHAVVLLNDGTPRVPQPLYNRIVYTSETVVFSSGAVGSAPMDFQWQYSGTNFAGATNYYLVLTNVPFSAAGAYGCIVSNPLGTVTNSCNLTVLRSTPQFSSSGSLSSAGFAGELDHLSGHGDVIVFASTDLVNWVPIFTNAPVTGSLQFLDSGATSQSRFYRAVEQ
jgi:alpha-tubulin suppressor-like RCC1 family protein